ncbi:hypothetical protein BaRGS_00020991, partial [Batillaria attramentaria]
MADLDGVRRLAAECQRVQLTSAKQNMFISLCAAIIEDLIKQGRLVGSVSGGRQDKSVYYPDIYTRSQNQWVDSFYAQNGYLEYDAVTRLGIPDVKNFLEKRFKGGKLLMLNACCIEANVKDALANDSWVDVKTYLPSSFSQKDMHELLTQCLRSHQGAFLCASTIVASQKLVNESAKAFSDLIRQKAEQ